jgi:hypothetical protein
MSFDDEETLGRELREVADGVQVPAMPVLPVEPSSGLRRWRAPLLVAAAVVVVAGVVAVATSGRDTHQPNPGPSPTPTVTVTPSETPADVTIPTTAPTAPYVLDQRLYVGGTQVPGTWWSVRAGGSAWIAIRTDNTWWWGRGPQAHEITGLNDAPPVISPNGRYVAETRIENGHGVVSGFDTRLGGEGLGSVPIDLGDQQDGSAVRVRAVTDDGLVIAQGTNTSLLWLPLAGNGTVDLTVTAPDQQFLGNTPAGLVVTDGSQGAVDATEGDPYLAEISDAGELQRIGGVPPHDDLLVTPGATWLAWTPPGSTSGDVTSISSLKVESIDGTQRLTLAAPDGWGFMVREYAWEDDDHLVSPVVGDEGERMARCSVEAGRCVLIHAG